MLRLNYKILFHIVVTRNKNNSGFAIFEGMYFQLLCTLLELGADHSPIPGLSVPAQYPNKAQTFGDWGHSPPPPHLASLSTHVCRGSHKHRSGNLGDNKRFRACAAADVASEATALPCAEGCCGI